MMLSPLKQLLKSRQPRRRLEKCTHVTDDAIDSGHAAVLGDWSLMLLDEGFEL